MDNRSQQPTMKLNQGNSVLKILQRSIENLHSLRKSRTPIPGRLRISLCSSYSVHEKALNCSKDELKSSNVSFKSTSTVKKNYKSGALFYKPQLTQQRFYNNPSPTEKFSKMVPRKNKYFKDSSHIARKIEFADEETSEKIVKEKLMTKLNKDLLEKAQQDIENLTQNKLILESKVKDIKESLCKVSSMHVEEQTTLLSIVNKLDKLEDIALNEYQEKRTPKIPSVIEKISSLEFNYSNLKSCNEGSQKNFKEEIDQINYKLQDLKECNSILKELVICLQKEPVIVTKTMQNAETSMELKRNEVIETVPLSKISDPDEILKDLYEKKEALTKEKEKMEIEYKNIPQESKSMSSKRRRQTLELELSMNYSKLMSICNKIKKYTS